MIYILTGTPIPPSGYPSGDGILDPLDAVFDAYQTQSRELAQQSRAGRTMATKLAVLCRNQLTIIAAIKYLAAIAERQGYTDLSSRVAPTLTALDRNVSIIAEVATEPRLSNGQRERGRNCASH